MLASRDSSSDVGHNSSLGTPPHGSTDNAESEDSTGGPHGSVSTAAMSASSEGVDSVTGTHPSGGPITTDPSSGTFEQGSSADTSEPLDECPEHEQRWRGSCGCGHDPHPLCEAIIGALVHRYPFVFPSNQPAPQVVGDSVGSADAAAFEPALKDDGALLLGSDRTYVELPSGIVSDLTEATFDLWVRWWGGDGNQRILNFGRAPDDGDAPENYLSISPKGSNGVLSVQFRTDTDDRGDRLETDSSLSTDNLEHITLVVRSNELLLYLNGDVAQTARTAHRLDRLDDTENWLGRALYGQYPRFNGALYEFRIFGRALTPEEIHKAHQVGLSLP